MQFYFDMDGTVSEWRPTSTIEDLYSKGYFLSLKPYMEIVNAAQSLAFAGVDVFILSCYLSDSKYALEEKNAWIDRHMPFVKKENRLFIPYGQSKTQYVQALHKISLEDVLIDDFSVNLHEWAAVGGLGVKSMNEINGTKGTWQGIRITKKTATDILLGLISRAA